MDEKPKQTIEYISITKIDDPQNSMRSDIGEAGLLDLISSIREVGIIEPIIVRPKGERYEVIAGHRRYAAAWRLHHAEMPCVVRNATDRETVVIRVHENLVREEVDPVSEALFLFKTMTELTWDQEECAKQIGRSVQYVQDRLDIAHMDEFMQTLIKEGKLKLGVALALNKIDNEKVRHQWTMSAVRDGMTVRGAEDALREYGRMSEIWNETETPADQRYIPTEPPVILWDCVKCGKKTPSDQLQYVRVHKGACPDEVPV